ncbi:MAG: 4Fe-4S binding protein [Epulopiscium sp.]|nr:4Fe-4S binding protein [Candidatus Epulonipiscium sp.]
MRKFESFVQLIKYKVLKEVALLAMEGTLEEKKGDIPKRVVPGPKPTTRCCIHKEHAILQERVALAMGGDRKNPNIIEVIDIACDECPIDRFTITEACRGCLAHKCSDVCPVDAIYYVGQRAYIDSNKCKECGKCKEACPYNAISEVMRPCMRACGAHALSITEDKKAEIDNDLCIQCGACVYQCPFGAIMDKSYIVDIIKLLKEAKENPNLRVYGVMAPAISSQFTYAKIGQVVSGIKKLGFHNVVEAALGADIIALHETQEFIDTIQERKVMTTSCCPAFVAYIEKNYPNLIHHISNSVSPMVAIGRLIKSTDPDAKVVFIGPCTAKKREAQEEDIKDAVDYVMTFEELQAMLDAMDIQVEECEEAPLDNASFYGRIFARSGGVTEAIQHIIEEKKLDLELKPISCDGLRECERALKMLKVGRLPGNFIEGMACVSGCIGGAASLSHGPKDKKEVDKYGKLAIEQNISDSLRIFDLEKIQLGRQK